MQDISGILTLDRKKYVASMAENLPALRAKLGLTQSDLAELIGVTRQTISAAENKSRDLSWTNFLSLLFLFSQNSTTKDLLTVLDIYTSELAGIFSLTDLKKLR